MLPAWCQRHHLEQGERFDVEQLKGHPESCVTFLQRGLSRGPGGAVSFTWTLWSVTGNESKLGGVAAQQAVPPPRVAWIGGELGRGEPPEVQQGQAQGPAPGEGQLCARAGEE